MDVTNFGLGLAFLGGLASFLSPCVFSLVPAYIGYLSGRSVGASAQGTEVRWQTVAHGVAFVLGFSAVFMLLVFGAAGGLLLGGLVAVCWTDPGDYPDPFLECG